MAEDPIEQVVVLMLENRQPGAARQVPNDPVHESKDVLVQLGGTGGIPQNGGFVLNYAQAYPQLEDPSEVMRYHDAGTGRVNQSMKCRLRTEVDHNP
jgi:hypothetical protein